MLGFVSHLHIIKSKLLVIEEPVERRGFSPVCRFMLGCERSQDCVSPGRRLAGVLSAGSEEEEGVRGGHPRCGSVTLMKPVVVSVSSLGREVGLCC